ncbi:SGNH/GDSL hydrolase family protein [Providencia sp. PROV258]|uniref:SGNH/GDSL hydrolase family protein n=1 Tax=Providencia sp. PROV258 TaxID=2949946 RepID=UPI00234AC51B|nr:hypothetical protein [Providencia sp. PROV258]
MTKKRRVIKLTNMMKPNILTALFIFSFSFCASASKPNACAYTAILFWGDSLTYGVGSESNNGYPNYFVGKGCKIIKKGFPGQTSSDIAIRQGGLSPIINTGKIKNGVYEITSLTPSGGFRKYKEMSFMGSISDAPVIMQRNKDNTWSIKSTAEINCSSGCQFITSESVSENNALNIIWVGRNNNFSFPRIIKRDIGLMISTLPHDNKYLVIGITPSLTDTKEDLENIRNINRILQDKYKSNFIDIWSELSKDGSIPRAMYSDDVHFNDLGYKAIAKIIEAKITQVQ